MWAKQKGFTIVELLIVIVVIGILAAITIVSYNGITARANTVRNQAGAVDVSRRMQVWQAMTGTYPTYAQLVTNSLSPTVGGSEYHGYVAGGAAGPIDAKLSSSAIVQYNTYPTFGTAETSYIDCATYGGGGTGYYIVYLDPSISQAVNAISVEATNAITYGSSPAC